MREAIKKALENISQNQQKKDMSSYHPSIVCEKIFSLFPLSEKKISKETIAI